MIQIETKYDIGDKVLANIDGIEKTCIIESVNCMVEKKQTEWPLRYHPESGKVEIWVTQVCYTLKMRNGYFTEPLLKCGKHIPDSSLF